MPKGIVIQFSTTNFKEAVGLCERSFADCTTPEWQKIKASNDFNVLSEFLSQHDIDNKKFELKSRKIEEEMICLN